MATFDDFRAALEARCHKIKRSGSAFSTTCPAHEDRNASLSFNEGDRTEVVATCHAGCTFEAILDALDLHAEPHNAAPYNDGRIEAVYAYTDENGATLYEAVRLRDPKTFRQRLPTGEWKLGDVRRVLYRLPNVLEAAKTGRAVVAAEGEKDVEALERLGFVATCSPMGAGKWRDEYAETLDGAPWFVIIADADEPGREHARTAVDSAHRRGIPSKLIDLAPDRDDGYDVSDFLLEHGDNARAELENLIRKTPTWPRNAPRKLPIVSGADFVESVKPHDVSKDYLGALVHGGERLHVIGPIGHGKTTLQMELLSAALRGDELLDFQGCGDIRGIYVDLEMPPHLLRQAIVDARLDQCPNFELWHRPEGLEIDRNEQHRLDLESVMRDHEIVVIDPWYKLIGDELAEGMANVKTVIAALDGWRARYPRTAVIVGFHANEPKEDAKLMLGAASGYKAYQRPADTALTFQRIAGNRSRLVWAKTRSAYLPPMGTTWTLDWSRGNGFVRVERADPLDELAEALEHGVWKGVAQLCRETGWGRQHVSETANRLVYDGRAQRRMIGRYAEFTAAPQNERLQDVA